MARGALGDYADMTETGRRLRRNLIPFYSWIESNTRRYANLFRNAFLYGRTKDKAINGAAVSAALILRIGIFYAGVQTFNNLFSPKKKTRCRLRTVCGCI